MLRFAYNVVFKILSFLGLGFFRAHSQGAARLYFAYRFLSCIDHMFLEVESISQETQSVKLHLSDRFRRGNLFTLESVQFWWNRQRWYRRKSWRYWSWFLFKHFVFFLYLFWYLERVHQQASLRLNLIGCSKILLSISTKTSCSVINRFAHLYPWCTSSSFCLFKQVIQRNLIRFY